MSVHYLNTSTRRHSLRRLLLGLQYLVVRSSWVADHMGAFSTADLGHDITTAIAHIGIALERAGKGLAVRAKPRRLLLLLLFIAS